MSSGLRYRAATVFTSTAMVVALSCAAPAPKPTQRMFETPQAAARTLIDVVNASNMEELLSLFGPDGKELVASSDSATGRRNREVFAAAVSEGWQLTEEGPNKRTLVIGNERWPFPIPLVREPGGWRFDTAAGKEEVLARRIGRNELAVIQICRTYVTAQRLYAKQGHDGKPSGLFAKALRSDPGRQNGLYWAVKHGEKRSPLGDLMAEAAAEGRTEQAAGKEPSPFHGYYFKILTAQGTSAAGGAKDYVINGEMSGGFGLVAWPATYDATGVMTFIVNQDGVVHENDLGPETAGRAKAMTRYDPDPSSWKVVR
jgi:hypothetical protein